MNKIEWLPNLMIAFFVATLVAGMMLIITGEAIGLGMWAWFVFVSLMVSAVIDISRDR